MNWKKIRNIIIWTLIAVYAVVAVGFVVEKRTGLVCKQLEVRITDSLQNEFVSVNRVKVLLKEKGLNPVGKDFSKIDLKKIEVALQTYPPIERAEAYKTLGGNLVVEIHQHRPILRIIDVDNNSYYIDDKGYVMRLSGNFTSHVIIANGSIHTRFPVTCKVNVLELEQKAEGKRIIVAELYKLVKFITEDKFWNAQIEQIYVNASGDIELVPLVGSHIIVIGDINDLETKFENLQSLYHNGFPAVGWNQYASINLKYKGQVICTKRE
jgi:cell division protein FtsQ